MITKKSAASPKNRNGRGTLFLISAIFFASVVTRIVGSGGELFAKEIEALTADHPTETTSAPHDIADGYSADQVKTLIDDLRARERGVEAKETAIANRLQALAVAETAFKQSIQDLTDAETALRATMALASTAAEDDLARLTSVYENMKPKDAAALFEEMAPEFSAGFLGRMRPETAASVMAGLTPTTAYSISVILAGRNASVPTE